MCANDVCSRSFPIRGGVRHGCVLSRGLLSPVLEMAMACWRASVEDLNLKDDILIPGTSYHVIGTLLDQIVENLAAVGLHLNMEPPPGLQTPNGLTISIIEQGSNHK